MKKLHGDRVIIEDEDIEKTKAGVYVAKTKNPDDMIIGKVVYVGRGKITDQGKLIEMETKVGDRVMIEYGKKITIEGKQYFLIKDEDVVLTF